MNDSSTCCQALRPKPELAPQVLGDNLVGKLEPELPVGPPIRRGLHLLQHSAQHEGAGRYWAKLQLVCRFESVRHLSNTLAGEVIKKEGATGLSRY